LREKINGLLLKTTRGRHALTALTFLNARQRYKVIAGSPVYTGAVFGYFLPPKSNARPASAKTKNKQKNLPTFSQILIKVKLVKILFKLKIW